MTKPILVGAAIVLLFVLGWSGVLVYFQTKAKEIPQSTKPISSTQQTFDVSKLSVVETWQFEYDLQTAGAFVPDIAEYKGKTIMYAFELGKGIVSFSSNAGNDWIKDEGVRIANGDGFEYSHPYAAIAPEGTLYLFLQTGKQGTKGPYFVSFSQSLDGYTFSKPAPIIRGSDFGGNHAAHGRVIKRNDGTYLLAISSGFDPPDPRSWAGAGSLFASSKDLRVWQFSSVFFAGCHDPTFHDAANDIRLYCQFQQGEIIRFDSPDGYQWDPDNPVGRVKFLDRNGTIVGRDNHSLADIDAHTFKDGTTRIFISVHPKGQPDSSVWSTRQ